MFRVCCFAFGVSCLSFNVLLRMLRAVCCVLCCALCCALYCAVCCVVLCCAVLCCVVLCCVFACCVFVVGCCVLRVVRNASCLMPRA